MSTSPISRSSRSSPDGSTLSFFPGASTTPPGTVMLRAASRFLRSALPGMP
jgi:hypothetical protein